MKHTCSPTAAPNRRVVRPRPRTRTPPCRCRLCLHTCLCPQQGCAPFPMERSSYETGFNAKRHLQYARKHNLAAKLCGMCVQSTPGNMYFYACCWKWACGQSVWETVTAFAFVRVSSRVSRLSPSHGDSCHGVGDASRVYTFTRAPVRRRRRTHAHAAPTGRNHSPIHAHHAYASVITSHSDTSAP